MNLLRVVLFLEVGNVGGAYYFHSDPKYTLGLAIGMVLPFAAVFLGAMIDGPKK